MRYIIAVIISILASSCSQSSPASKRVSVASGNISFDLPQVVSNHKASKLYQPCLTSSDYLTPASHYFSNDDKSFTIFLIIENPIGLNKGWNFDGQQQLYALTSQYPSVKMDTTIIDRPKKTAEVAYKAVRFGRKSYIKEIRIQGKFRTFTFRFCAPDTPMMRRTVESIKESIEIDPKFLNDVLGRYPETPEL
jgi:hypothetical protein